MHFFQSLAQTPTRQIFDVAKAVEAAGFAGVTMSDHLLRPKKVDSQYPYSPDGRIAAAPSTPYPDCWVLAGALAQVTERIRLMPSVFVLPLRDPFSASKSILSAAVLSRERLMLGVGVGWMREEFELTGQPFAARGRRSEEMLEILQKLSTGEMVEHHGEFYDFPEVQMQPAPTRCPPILIGGHSETALRRAAALDGWIGVNYDFDQALEVLASLRKARQQSGRQHESYEVALSLNAPPDRDDVRRLEDAGATILVNVPLGAPHAATQPLEAKLAEIEKFAERLIR